MKYWNILVLSLIIFTFVYFVIRDLEQKNEKLNEYEQYREQVLSVNPNANDKLIIVSTLDAAKKYKINPKLILEMIRTESTYRQTAVSGAGAVGYMQLMKATAEGVCGLIDRENGYKNIDCGVKYLAKLKKRFKGDMEKALCFYNAGGSMKCSKAYLKLASV